MKRIVEKIPTERGPRVTVDTEAAKQMVNQLSEAIAEAEGLR